MERYERKVCEWHCKKLGCKEYHKNKRDYWNSYDFITLNDVVKCTMKWSDMNDEYKTYQWLKIGVIATVTLIIASIVRSYCM